MLEAYKGCYTYYITGTPKPNPAGAVDFLAPGGGANFLSTPPLDKALVDIRDF